MSRLNCQFGRLSRPVLAFSLVICGGTLLCGVIFGQGPLTPPGAPTPTMKSLDQVRSTGIAINATNTPPDASTLFVISSPGSYYLTGNLTGAATKSGIAVAADNVSIDLNGFTMTGNSGITAIIVTSARKNITISNGTMTNWGSNAINAQNATNALITDMQASGNAGDAFVVGANSILRNVIAASNGAAGISVVGNNNRIERNNAISNTAYGIHVTGTKNLIVENNANGNTPDYSIAAGNNSGQIVPSPGANFVVPAWANFAGGCSAGFTACSNVCVNTTNDSNNCGGCGTVCGAGQVCAGSACVPSCQAGLTNCSGVCTNLQTSNQNCGGCGTPCAAGNVCSSGSCVLSCQTGLTNCGGVCTNTQSSDANCGGCGTVCAAGKVCSAGSCVLSCQSGLTNCSGVCRDLTSDEQHCGSCATICSASQHCINSVCQ